MSKRPPATTVTPFARPHQSAVPGAPEALLEALPKGAATVLASALERLSDPAGGPVTGLSEAGTKYETAPTAAPFEDSVRLQRLFAAIDSEERRQALLYVAEVLAADRA
ncbi:MAG: hypothetical protein ACKVP4_11825 [Hyphomicrobium sp.]